MRATHLFVGERLPDGRLTPYTTTTTTCSRRSLAVAVITGASYVGAVIAFALTPWIIQHYGWRQVGKRNPACLHTHWGFSVSMSSILINNRLFPRVHYTSHHHPPSQVFYLFGAAPLAWFPLWWGLMASSRPAPQQPAAAAPPAPASTTLRSKRKYLQDPLVPSLPSPSSSREEGGAGLTWPEIRRIASRKEVGGLLVEGPVCGSVDLIRSDG